MEAGVPQGKDPWEAANWVAPAVPLDIERTPFCQCGHRRDHHPTKACVLDECGCRRFRVHEVGTRYV